MLTHLAIRNFKKSFHVLARHVPRDEIAPEVAEKLDAIARVAEAARGRV